MQIIVFISNLMKQLSSNAILLNLNFLKMYLSAQVGLSYLPDSSLMSTFHLSVRPSPDNPAPECFILEILPGLGILANPLWEHFFLKTFPL